jgi:hypothetical protein
VTVKTIVELEGTIEPRVIEPIYSSETSIRSSRVTRAEGRIKAIPEAYLRAYSLSSASDCLFGLS